MRKAPFLGAFLIYARGRHIDILLLTKKCGIFFEYVPYQFSEDSIGPGKPFTGEFFRIVFIKRLMHKACAGMRCLQHFEALPDFRRIITGMRPHYNRHWPYKIKPRVRAAYTFSQFSFEIKWI